MLVLSRKVNERIQIGANVTVTIVKVSPHSVRIGIEAPSDMVIVRQELTEGGESERLPHLASPAIS